MKASVQTLLSRLALQQKWASLSAMQCQSTWWTDFYFHFLQLWVFYQVFQLIDGVFLSHTTILGSTTSSETEFSAAHDNAITSRELRYIQTNDTRYIIDTDASDHIMSRKYITKEELKSIRKAPYVMNSRLRVTSLLQKT